MYNWVTEIHSRGFCMENASSTSPPLAFFRCAACHPPSPFSAARSVVEPKALL